MQRLGTVGANYLNITGAASNTIVNIRQRIESQNIADLAGQQVTVSFVCSASVATSVSVTLGHASAQDNFGTVTTIGTVTKTINAVGNRYDCQFTLPAGAANGVEVIFGISNMTSGTFALTNVQLEAGAVATPFERRSYGTELALCQRYFCSSFLTGYAVANGANYDYGGVYTTAAAFGLTSAYCPPVCFPVSMRAAPTFTPLSTTLGATDGRWVWYNGSTWTTATGTSAQAVRNTCAGVSIDSASAWAANQAKIVIGAWKAEAEL
jgi:hypothetical protein